MPALVTVLPGEEAQGLAELTATELSVLTLMAEGMSNVAIAAELVVSVRTVEGHINRIFRKFGLSDPGCHPRVAAVLLYLDRRPG